MFYKLVRVNFSINIPPRYSSLASTYNTRQFHPLHFMVLWSSTTYYQMSFFPKTIQDWNNYPIGLLNLTLSMNFLMIFANN